MATFSLVAFTLPLRPRSERVDMLSTVASLQDRLVSTQASTEVSVRKGILAKVVLNDAKQAGWLVSECLDS